MQETEKKQKLSRFTVEIEPHHHRSLKAKAAQYGISMRQIIIKLITEFVESTNSESDNE